MPLLPPQTIEILHASNVGAARRAAKAVARELLQALAKEEDDATVLVIKNGIA